MNEKAKYAIICLLLSGVASCLGGTWSAENSREIIPENGRHRGFPQLILHDGVYFLGYREASAHTGKDGIGHVLYSQDGIEWREMLALKEKGFNFHSPRFFEFQDSLCIDFEKNTDTDPSVYSAYNTKLSVDSHSVAETGVADITLNNRVVDMNVYLGWQVRPYNGKLYNPFYGGGGGGDTVFLMESEDGVNWTTISTNFISTANETDIVFHSNMVYSVARPASGSTGCRGVVMNMDTLAIEDSFVFDKTIHAPVIFSHDGNDYVMGRACGDSGELPPYSGLPNIQQAHLYQIDWAGHTLNWIMSLPDSEGWDNGYTAIAPMGTNRYLVAHYATNHSDGGVYAYLPSIWTCELVYVP